MLLTSDLHYRLPQYDWVLRAAERFDAVAIAGDHVDAFAVVPAHVQIAALRASLTAIAERSHLLICSGNHDLNGRSEGGEKFSAWVPECRSERLAVDGDSVTIGDTLVTICGWWDGPASQTALLEQLQIAAATRQGRWLWLYHAPPPGKLSWNGRRHFADAFLAELIERFAPTAVLCGHIHEAPFTAAGAWAEKLGATWVFNAGRQIGEVPARVEIDFARGEAVWTSLAGQETIALQ